MYFHSKSIRSWCNGSYVRSFMVDPVFFSHSSQCSMTGVTKVMVCGMVHIKKTLLKIRKSSPLMLSEWSFTIYL